MASAVSEIENPADDFFEPEPSSMAPAAPEEAAEASFEQPVRASNFGESSATEFQAEHTPDVPAKEPHWMDAVAASESQRPQSDWMTALGEQQAERAQAEVSAQLTAGEANSALLDAPAESAGRSADEEAFFADEPESGESAQDMFVNQSPAPDVNEEFEARPFVSPTFPVDQFFPSEDDRATTSPHLFKDPDLVEPPAVHVTPEPLLVDDEPKQFSEYGSHVEELPPAHSFFVPEADQAIAEESTAQDATAPEEAPVPLLSAAPEVDERIPTGHPPSLEALTDIPFLVPPPGFRPDAPQESAADSETVDAVVRRVLEKLEPQLHELLSQGVLKPLVESLLQGELAKKER